MDAHAPFIRSAFRAGGRRYIIRQWYAAYLRHPSANCIFWRSTDPYDFFFSPVCYAGDRKPNNNVSESGRTNLSASL